MGNASIIEEFPLRFTISDFGFDLLSFPTSIAIDCVLQWRLSEEVIASPTQTLKS
jgi:hypothetical protein